MSQPRLSRPSFGRRAWARIPVCALVLGISLPWLCSCLSAPSGRSDVEQGQAISLPPIDQLETRLVEIEYQTRDSARAQAIQDFSKTLRDLRRLTILDKAYFARLYSISGELFLMDGDRSSAQSMLKSADSALGYGLSIGQSDPAPVLRALLVSPISRRREILETSVKPIMWKDTEGGVPPRLLCCLAKTYLELKRYEDARRVAESALPRMTETLRIAYAPLTDQINAGIDRGLAQTTDGQGLDISQEKPLRLSSMALCLKAEAPDLFSSTIASSGDALTILAYMAQNRYLKPDGAGSPNPDSPTRRRDAFPGLFWFYSAASGEKGLEFFYTKRYAPSSGIGQGKSPIADLPYGDPVFNEALALIERGIVDLGADGKLNPDQAVSGLEYLEWVARIKKVAKNKLSSGR